MAERTGNGIAERARALKKEAGAWTKGALKVLKREMEELGEGRIAGRPWREALSQGIGRRRGEAADKLAEPKALAAKPKGAKRAPAKAKAPAKTKPRAKTPAKRKSRRS